MNCSTSPRLQREPVARLMFFRFGVVAAPGRISTGNCHPLGLTRIDGIHEVQRDPSACPVGSFKPLGTARPSPLKSVLNPIGNDQNRFPQFEKCYRQSLNVLCPAFGPSRCVGQKNQGLLNHPSAPNNASGQTSSGGETRVPYILCDGRPARI